MEIEDEARRHVGRGTGEKLGSGSERVHLEALDAKDAFECTERLRVVVNDEDARPGVGQWHDLLTIRASGRQPSTPMIAGCRLDARTAEVATLLFVAILYHFQSAAFHHLMPCALARALSHAWLSPISSRSSRH